MSPTLSVASRYLATVSVSLFLVACGGGGGGGSSSANPVGTAPPTTPAPVTPPAPVVTPLYTLNPGTLSRKYVAGFPVTIDAKATQTTPFVGIAYIRISADSNVIASATASTNADGSFDVAIATAASATPGHYAGNLTVNVCKDAACTAQLDGAPFKVPYVIDVVSPDGGVTTSNLAAIAPLAGSVDWNGFQGNAGHTGLVPVTLSPAAFTVRWKFEAAAANGNQMTISDIVTGDGQLYFSTGSFWDASTQGHRLFALKERDGAQAWNHDFSDLHYASTNPPGFANGKVYLAAGSQESTAMFGFDAASGTQLFASPMASQWETYLAPVVLGNSVYTEGGTYGGMYAFDAAGGKRQWFADVAQVDHWTPAVDAERTYVYIGNRLQINDRLTGDRIDYIDGPSAGSPSGVTPLLAGPNSVIVAGPAAMLAIDTAAKNVRWKIDGNFRPGPAYGNKLVYALRDEPLALEARTAAWHGAGRPPPTRSGGPAESC